MTDKDLLEILKSDLHLLSHKMSRFQICEYKVRIKYLEDKLSKQLSH